MHRRLLESRVHAEFYEYHTTTHSYYTHTHNICYVHMCMFVYVYHVRVTYDLHVHTVMYKRTKGCVVIINYSRETSIPARRSLVLAG